MNVYKVRTTLLCFLVSGIFGGWVDPDTDRAYYSTEALTKGDDREYKLVSLTRNPFYSSATTQLLTDFILYFFELLLGILR